MKERRNEGRPESGRPSTLGAAGDDPAESVPVVHADAWRPLDAALAAHAAGRKDATLLVRTDVGGDDEMPVAHFHRGPSDMPDVERLCLEAARGRVLDLGAGVGAFAVPLVRRGACVTALEILPTARRLLAEAGVVDVRDGGLEAVGPEERFDTILAMMNGIGLCGTVTALPIFLAALADALTPDGQILADSTVPRHWEPIDDGRYVGEVHMQLVFDGAAGPPFPFLFVDDEALGRAARLAGLSCEVLARQPDDRYLARLTKPISTVV